MADNCGIQGRTVVANYLGVSAVANVAWEFAHMPLYAVWRSGTNTEILYNGLHCSIGDVMIASFALLVGVLVGGVGRWPRDRWPAVSAITIAAGLVYTAFSEWLNTSVRNAWAYDDFMPLVPGAEIGLSPIAQWIVIPSIALISAHRHARQRAKQKVQLLPNTPEDRA